MCLKRRPESLRYGVSLMLVPHVSSLIELFLGWGRCRNGLFFVPVVFLFPDLFGCREFRIHSFLLHDHFPYDPCIEYLATCAGTKSPSFGGIHVPAPRSPEHMGFTWFHFNTSPISICIFSKAFGRVSQMLSHGSSIEQRSEVRARSVNRHSSVGHCSSILEMLTTED